MTGQTISAHVDEPLAQRLKDIGRIDNRPSSELLGVALEWFLSLTPSARRVAFSIEGSCGPEERDFAARMTSRSILKAYQTLLESRHLEDIREKHTRVGTNSELLTEEDIESEAARACST